MKDQASINRLHAEYERLSERPITLTMSRVFTWESFLNHGWTEADLALVIGRLKTLIKEKKKWDSCLLFSRLIQDHEAFEECLSEARALARVPTPNYRRQEVLKAAGRTEEPKTRFRTSEEVLASDAFKALLNIRDGGAG